LIRRDILLPMAYSEILYDVADRVATITLNRPDKLNAWTVQMNEELADAFGTAERDESVRAIILTGAGRGFCAGADMALLGQIAAAGNVTGVRSSLGNTVMMPRTMSKPVIAGVNGPAVGFGMILALFCDIRFASPDARFGTAFARRGLIAEYGVAWLLPRLIGPAHALDLLMTARIIDGEEAARIGLVNRTFPAEQFTGKVRDYARMLANESSPRSVGIVKRQIYASVGQTIEEAMSVAEHEMTASLQCADFREGVSSWMEKRAAQFSGR
jgi:enoyl-CoA hydratase/carnithine racemase